MQAKPKQNKRNEEVSALITQEWQLVLEGKNAEQLVEIIQNYELDPLTNFIQQNQQMLKIYVWALLITGNYLELKFLIARYPQQLQKAPLTAIAEAGAAENLNNLCKNFTEYTKLLNDRQLLSRLNEATLKAVLTILSKYFITYSSSQIVSWLGCKQQDIRKLGYTVQNGYVELKKQQKTRECLLNKLRELVIVSNKMSKFE